MTRHCTMSVRRQRFGVPGSSPAIVIGGSRISTNPESQTRIPTAMVPSVVISARGEERLRSGHPWIYRADVADVRAEAGDRVVVRGPRGRTLGQALYSDKSQIAIRMLTHGEQAADEALIRARIGAALAFRETLAIDATAYRLVHGE